MPLEVRVAVIGCAGPMFSAGGPSSTCYCSVAFLGCQFAYSAWHTVPGGFSLIIVEYFKQDVWHTLPAEMSTAGRARWWAC